jgi:CheY-specific phosphatase CheX
MKLDMEATLSQVAVETLEQLAFIFAEPVDEGRNEDPDEGEEMVAAAVAFGGPFAGRLVIAIAAEVLPELASNMLGVEDASDIGVDQQHDALKETLNVICGNLLPALAGKQAIFKIGAPDMIPAGQTGIEAGGDQTVTRAKLDLDEGYCQLSLAVDATPSSM